MSATNVPINKLLYSLGPGVTGFGGRDASDFVTPAGAETLTNKTVDLADNTVTGTIAEFNTALSDGDFATLAGTETLTGKTIDGDLNTLLDIGTGSLKTKTGADDSVVTGTAGANGQIAGWNVDGDLVDAGYAAVDEDDMASNSAVKLPTQQSVKAYADSVVAPFVRRHRYGALDLADYATSDAAWTSIKNGSTAVDTIWADAVDDVALQGATGIRVTAGDYVVSGDSLENTGFKVIGEPGQVNFHRDGVGYLFSATGATPAVSGATLASNVAAGARAITVGTGEAAAFAVDQRCILVDDGALITSGTGKHGEYVVIQDITGDVITFWGALQFAYTTANTAKLIPVTLIENVEYQDINVLMDDTITIGTSTSGQHRTAFLTRFCLEPKFRNVRVQDMVGPGIGLMGCVRARILGYHAVNGGSSTTGTSDPASTEGVGGFSYAIFEEGLNEGLIASHLSIERCRHGYSTGGTLSSDFVYGWPKGSVISNGVHIGAKNAAWDTHADGFGITFSNLQAIGGRQMGFQLRSANHKLIGCSAQEMFGPAVWVRGGSTSSSQANNSEILDFTAIRTNLGTAGGTDYTEYGAIMDEAANTVIDGFSAELCGGPAVTLGRNGVANGTKHRNISAVNVAQLAVTNTFAHHIIATNASARVVVENLTSRSDDAKITHVARLDESTNTPTILYRNIRGTGHTGNYISAADDTYTVVEQTDGPRSLGIRGPYLFDDFLGRTLDSNVWLASKGSDGSAANPTIYAAIGGELRCYTGADAGGTVALNGSCVTGHPHWRADQGAISLQARITPGSTLANTVFFFGFSNLTSLHCPFSLGASNALTVAAGVTNACGILYDPAADDDALWLVGVSGGTPATHVNTTIVPATSTYAKYRIDISTAGVMKVYRAGLLIGSAVTGAVGVTTLLSPCFVAFSRTNAQRIVSADYIWIEQALSTRK